MEPVTYGNKYDAGSVASVRERAAGRAQQDIPFIVLTFGEESTGVSRPLLEEKEVMAETESGCVEELIGVGFVKSVRMWTHEENRSQRSKKNS